MASIKGAELKPYAYYQTGGSCDILYLPESVEELQTQVKEIHLKKRKFFLLGAGSNSLIWDGHFTGAVIAFHKLNSITVNGATIIAQSGVENSNLAKVCLGKGLAGAAWMYRLPGQLGATTRMNARCYGGEISQIVTGLRCVDRFGVLKVYGRNDIKKIFRGYKDTIFMRNDEIIAEIEITLTPGDPQTIKEKMDFCESDRVAKDQFIYPTCGCVFKNDYSVGVPSGMLLEHAGAKQLVHNGCRINQKHANFVYNIAASASDILELSFLMREAVYVKFGVWLEYEMEILGDLPESVRVKVAERRTPRWDEGALKVLREKFSRAIG